MANTTARSRSSASGRVVETAMRARWRAKPADEIRSRLRVLDRECDAEQALKANAATIALSGLAGGGGGDLRAFTLPAMVAASLVQYVLTGRCPPLAILRGMGFRTRAEIDAERRTLKSLLGDISPSATACRDSGRHRRETAASAKRRATRASTPTRTPARRPLPNVRNI